MPEKYSEQQKNTKVPLPKFECEMNLKQEKRTSWMDVAESFSLLVSTMTLFTWYNAVGELASRRGLDYAWVVDKYTYSFDRALPLVPHFVFFYIGVYFMPIAFLACAVHKYGFDMGLIRRFFALQMVLILSAFFFYYAFPTKTDLITDPVTGEIDVDISSTWVHALNYRFIHQGISMWVAAPSMHCGHAFSIAFAFTMLELPYTRVAQFMAFITLFSTTLCKPHPIMHLF
jgi:hypothetical protein